MTNFRILAAEFMGWERIAGPYWRDPVYDTQRNYVEDLPDPENNANDCEALVRELAKHGWACTVTIGHRSDKVLIGIACKTDAVPYECDDWKQGVCALAEPILRDDDGST